MDAGRKMLIVAGGLLGLALAVGLRFAQGGLTSAGMIGALVAVVAVSVVLTIMLTRPRRAATRPTGTPLPGWVWWLVGVALMLRVLTYLMDRYQP